MARPKSVVLSGPDDYVVYTSLRIPAEIKKELKILAARYGQSYNAVCLQALREFVIKHLS